MRFPNTPVQGSPWSRKSSLAKAVPISEDNLVRMESLKKGQQLPCVMRAATSGVDLAGWAAGQRVRLDEICLKYGAILFRNFAVHDARDLNRAIEATSSGPLEYQERSSPRSTVEGRIYTSTDYPPSLDIFPHNEHSYSLTFPLRLYFCCITPAAEGGETPIADTRRILGRISAPVRRKFAEKGWMYVRNFGEGFGLTWQNSFQTEDPSVVESYCKTHGIDWEWYGQRLRTRQVRPALARHPQTGEEIWFNHATFFHISTLEPSLRNGLLTTFQASDLPNNTYYSDGTEIENEALEELRNAYLSECVLFPWQHGDVLMIDNMLTAHARKAYRGDRKILVGMANPHTRTDV
jgi:alpha-ketoglutarate-dependent taurine dioxygenase